MYRSIAILGCVAVLAMLPALALGPPAVDSAIYNYNWTAQLSDEMARGNLYPRWLPQSFEGLGSPTFYFYPPLAFLLAGAFGQLMETAQAISAAGLLMLFASGLSMFAWLRGKTDRPLLWAAIYMIAPYHLGDFYVRAALAEFGSFVWLPLIALGIEHQPKRWALPLLSFAYAGLLSTHLLMALLATVFLVAPLVIWRCWTAPRLASHCFVGGILGLALAAGFLLPALSLQDHTSIRVLWGPLYAVSAQTIWTSGQTNIFYAMTWIAAGWGVISLGVALRGGVMWPLLAALALLAAVGALPLFWELPMLDRVQFPWRVLAIAEFFAVTAAAIVRPRGWILALGAVLMFRAALPFGLTAQWGYGHPLDGELISRRVDAFEYLPPTAGVVATPDRKPDLAGLGTASISGPAEQLSRATDGGLTVKATGDGVVTLRRFNFPIWTISGSDKKAPLLPGPLVRFRVSDDQIYRVSRTPAPSESLGYLCSALALVVLALHGISASRRRR